MFKLTQDENQVCTLSEVSVEGHETIPANTTIPKGHRLWATYEAWLAQGNTPEPYDNRTQAERLADTKRELTQAVQKHMDDTARTHGYDGIISCTTYATSLNPKFSAEGQAAVEWRDNVWVTCYQILDDVKAGNRPIPTEDELIAELPVLTWPNV